MNENDKNPLHAIRKLKELSRSLALDGSDAKKTEHKKHETQKTGHTKEQGSVNPRTRKSGSEGTGEEQQGNRPRRRKKAAQPEQGKPEERVSATAGNSRAEGKLKPTGKSQSADKAKSAGKLPSAERGKSAGKARSAEKSKLRESSKSAEPSKSTGKSPRGNQRRQVSPALRNRGNPGEERGERRKQSL